MRLDRFLRLLLIGLLLGGTTAQGAEPELQVIQLKHRSAEELIPVLQPLLNSNTRIAGHGYQLFVRASTKELREIQQLLESLDIAKRNLRISIKRSGSGESVNTQQSISGEHTQGRTRIILSSPPTNSGVRIQNEKGDGLNYQAERRVVTRREDHNQFLTVLDGGQGFIRVGQSIPRVQPLLALAGNKLVIAAGVEYYDATTGFEVSPRLHGDSVELKITPRFTFLGTQGAQTVDFEELSTQANVKLGEWVELGGLVNHQQAVTRAIFSTRERNSDEKTGILIKVE